MRRLRTKTAMLALAALIICASFPVAAYADDMDWGTNGSRLIFNPDRDEYLHVYVDEWGNLYSERRNLAGQVIDDQPSFYASNVMSYSFDIVYNPESGDYLLVWTEYGGQDAGPLMMAWVDGEDPSRLQGESVSLCETNCVQPRLAYDANNHFWVLIYEDQPAGQIVTRYIKSRYEMYFGVLTDTGPVNNLQLVYDPVAEHFFVMWAEYEYDDQNPYLSDQYLFGMDMSWRWDGQQYHPSSKLDEKLNLGRIYPLYHYAATADETLGVITLREVDYGAYTVTSVVYDDGFSLQDHGTPLVLDDIGPVAHVSLVHHPETNRFAVLWEGKSNGAGPLSYLYGNWLEPSGQMLQPTGSPMLLGHSPGNMDPALVYNPSAERIDLIYKSEEGYRVTPFGIPVEPPQLPEVFPEAMLFPVLSYDPVRDTHIEEAMDRYLLLSSGYKPVDGHQMFGLHADWFTKLVSGEGKAHAGTVHGLYAYGDDYGFDLGYFYDAAYGQNRHLIVLWDDLRPYATFIQYDADMPGEVFPLDIGLFSLGFTVHFDADSGQFVLLNVSLLDETTLVLHAAAVSDDGIQGTPVEMHRGSFDSLQLFELVRVNGQTAVVVLDNENKVHIQPLAVDEQGSITVASQSQVYELSGLPQLPSTNWKMVYDANRDELAIVLQAEGWLGYATLPLSGQQQEGGESEVHEIILDIPIHDFDLYVDTAGQGAVKLVWLDAGNRLFLQHLSTLSEGTKEEPDFILLDEHGYEIKLGDLQVVPGHHRIHLFYALHGEFELPDDVIPQTFQYGMITLAVDYEGALRESDEDGRVDIRDVVRTFNRYHGREMTDDSVAIMTHMLDAIETVNERDMQLVAP